MSYDPELFKGAVEFYDKYRPGYPDALYNELSKRATVDQNTSVLDVGAGTGEIALHLAPHVARITALDPDAEMLAKLRAKKAGQSITNIYTVSGTFEAFAETEQEKQFDLITFGASLHWIRDQEKAFKHIRRLLVDNGWLAILFGTGVKIWTEDPSGGWRYDLTSIIKRYLGPERRAGQSTFSERNTKQQELFEERLLKEKEHFGCFTTIIVMYKKEYTIDELIGLLYSTSFARKDYFGSKHKAFENERYEHS